MSDRIQRRDARAICTRFSAVPQSGIQSLPDHSFHSLGEDVHFAQSAVNVGGDANPFELRMSDRSRDDPVLIEQVFCQLLRINALDVDQRQPTRLFWIVAGQYLHALLPFEPFGPTVEEETQPGGFALGADAFMEIERLVDGQRVRRRVRADLLELADVGGVLLIRSHQRPQAGDFRLANIQEACAVRRQQPFVQARAVIVAIQIGVFVWEMREKMRAGDYCLDAARARPPADAFYPLKSAAPAWAWGR